MRARRFSSLSFYIVNRRFHITSAILIVVLGASIYASSLSGEFIWDDRPLVINNGLIRSLKNTPKILSTGLVENHDYYRPLQNLTYAIDYSLWKLNPFGYRLSNLILHILGGLFLYWLISLLFKDKLISLLISLFFLTHPLYTESVSYISGRAEELMGLFLFLSLIFYIKSSKIISFSYLASLVCFSLSLLSKEIVIVFPFLFLLCDRYLYPANKGHRRWLAFFILAGIYISLRASVFNFAGEPLLARVNFSPEVSFFARILTLSKSILIYLSILFLPFNLHMERTIGPVESLLHPSVFVFLGISLFCLLRMKKLPSEKRRIIHFGLLWSSITLFPQSSLIFPCRVPEHFLYLPSIGIFLILAVAFKELYRKKRLFALALSVILVSFYSIQTIVHSLNWQDNLRFYLWTLRHSPRSYKAHYQLGNTYIRLGLIGKAQNSYEKALGLNPPPALLKELRGNLRFFPNPEARSYLHYNLGVAFAKRGLWDEAEKDYREAIDLNPSFVQAYNNLGAVYVEKGMDEEALREYQKAVELDPEFAKAHYNIGQILEHRGKLKEAIKSWQEALRIAPEYEAARQAIEKARRTQGKD